MEALFLKGTFREKIWGGEKLATEFGYEIPSNKTGEYWAISGHRNGPSTVINGPYAGKTIDELWKQHRELFGNEPGEVFPLLTKILDAQADLSVQVHPDDAYGLKHEGDLGKTECWYILSAEDDAEIVYGHHAETKEELEEKIAAGEWDELLHSEKVKAGDFFYLPSGTIHAIGSGIMILETQQSSDTTYRLYDYDRRDDDGNLRDLHIEKSIDVTTVPHKDYEGLAEKTVAEDGVIEKLVASEFFSVYQWIVDGLVDFKAEGPYTLVSVIQGDGKLILGEDNYSIKKGDHFILPHGITEWQLDGQMELIASHT